MHVDASYVLISSSRTREGTGVLDVPSSRGETIEYFSTFFSLSCSKHF